MKPLSDADKRYIEVAKNDIRNKQAIIEEYKRALRLAKDQADKAFYEREIRNLENYISGLRSEIRYSYGVSI